jgi:hypothetical protein
LNNKLTVNKSSEGFRLAVKVTPGAGRNEIAGFKNGILHVKVNAAPEKGKANQELIDFLAEKLEIKKSSVLIIKGLTGRHKVIFLQGISRDVLSRLVKI